MRTRGTFWIVIVLLAAFLPLQQPVQSQTTGGAWSAWLYHAASPQLLRVSEDGAAPAIPLPMTDRTFILHDTLAFSRDGRRVAYCFTEGYNTESNMRVLDLEAGGTPLLSYQGGDGESAGSGVLSDDGRFLAAPIFTNCAAGDCAWDLRFYDLDSGQVVGSLSSDAEAVVSAIAGYPSPGVDNPVTPRVMAVTDDTVVFWLMPSMGQSLGQYVWTVSANTLEPADPVLHWDESRLDSTGERVWTAYSEDFPAWDPGEDPSHRPNVLTYLAPDAQSSYPIFAQAAELRFPRFVDGGRRIAFLVSGGQPFEEPFVEQWMALDRDGGVLPLPLEANEYPFGADGGFVFLERSRPTAELDFYRFDGDALTLQTLWQNPDPRWSIVWTTPLDASGEALSPFPAVEP